ncbi:MAG: SRPBCC family protein [Actinomycetota bacterium]
MTSGEFETTIQAPADRVWPWVADLGRHAPWSPKPYSVAWTAGEPNAVGSRFRSVGAIPGDANHTNEGEIVESAPPNRFVLRAQDPQGSYLSTYTLTPQGAATKVTFRLDFLEMHGMSALLAPVLFPLVGKKEIRGRMALLKSTVEASTEG